MGPVGPGLIYVGGKVDLDPDARATSGVLRDKDHCPDGIFAGL